jgi:putative transcriptional regulator
MKIKDPGIINRELDLRGHFLISMPGMGDPRFERCVIYLCSHSSAGAMGIIVNKLLEDITFTEIRNQLIAEDQPEKNAESGPDVPVYLGGPVERGRGFVLHSADYSLEASLEVNSEINLTASIEIIEDIAHKSGPDKYLLALGYAGWGEGQLEAELAENSWLNCEATPEILFEPNPKAKYEGALALMGVDAALLSADAGHA